MAKPNNDKSGDSAQIINIIQSVLAAAFGVQQQKNYHRDFTQGKPSHFIAAGLVATILFILILAGIVQLILLLCQ